MTVEFDSFPDEILTTCVDLVRSDTHRVIKRETGLDFGRSTPMPISVVEFGDAVHLRRSGVSFHTAIALAYINADTANRRIIEAVWPVTAASVQQRWDAPGGLLPGEDGFEVIQQQRKLAMEAAIGDMDDAQGERLKQLIEDAVEEPT